MRAQASILVSVLWCLALLSVVVIGVLHTARLELLVGKNHGDRIQAHYLALAGVEKAKALLYQEARDRSRSGKNHSGELYNAPQQFRDISFGRGEFRVFRQGRQDEGGGVIYGVSDEESRLSLNYASTNELVKLYGMTPDVVAAILDWRDEDNVVTPGGAEVEYYSTLQPPYLPRNGPFQTIRELLMVRGVSRELLFGERGAKNQDGGDAADSSPAEASDDVLNAGWSGILTVDSSVQNVNAAGQARVDIQSADEASLTSVKGITSAMAKAIINYRGQNRFDSLDNLLDVTAGQNQSAPQGNTSANGSDTSQTGQNQSAPPPQRRNAPNNSGANLISQDLLMDVADDLATVSDADLPGLVNINTASLEVLACLPGITRELAQAIISYRQSSGFFPNVAWLLKVPGITRQIFKQVYPRVSVRSETFRILSEGKVSSTGARQRIMVIVHVGLHEIETLSYREDDL